MQEEGKEAQEKLNLALRRPIQADRTAGQACMVVRRSSVHICPIMGRRTQRRHDTLCALQASLEAPKDPHTQLNA